MGRFSTYIPWSRPGMLHLPHSRHRVREKKATEALQLRRKARQKDNGKEWLDLVAH